MRWMNADCNAPFELRTQSLLAQIAHRRPSARGDVPGGLRSGRARDEDGLSGRTQETALTVREAVEPIT